MGQTPRLSPLRFAKDDVSPLVSLQLLLARIQKLVFIRATTRHFRPFFRRSLGYHIESVLFKQDYF